MFLVFNFVSQPTQNTERADPVRVLASLSQPPPVPETACLTHGLIDRPIDVLIQYLSCLPGLAEERGLGCEEGEVFALVVQAAVSAAHAVTAGHGGGDHCVDSHGEVQRQRPAPAQERGGGGGGGGARPLHGLRKCCLFFFQKRKGCCDNLLQSLQASNCRPRTRKQSVLQSRGIQRA